MNEMQEAIDAFARAALVARRATFVEDFGERPVLVCAGSAPSRNYPQNRFPFRASSHFLHFVGLAIEGAALVLGRSGSKLFVPIPDADDALWHGPSRGVEELGALLGIEVRPLTDLRANAEDAVALDSFESSIRTQVEEARVEVCRGELETKLKDALIRARLHHDALAVRELRRAATITSRAHRAGMAATRAGIPAAVPRAVMEAVFSASGFTTAYGSIVTPRGDVLHAGPTNLRLSHGDLLLCDVGAETSLGYAADVTRTYPVGGSFERDARELYEIVLRAQQDAISKSIVGARYRDVHLEAMRSLARGLVELGVLLGDAEERAFDGSVALFFPHGIGHLLGLDVHDMEDLGDSAGYARGRERSTEPGLRYLRLDRDLEPSMALTIEPGVYFVDALLSPSETRRAFAGRVDFARVDRMSRLRGIRIEDDILVSDAGPEVLTRSIPKSIDALEEAIGAGPDWASFLRDEGSDDPVDTQV